MEDQKIKNDAGEEFLTLEELAARLKLNKMTIYKRCWSNKLPHYRMGTKYLFLLSEVLAALKQGERKHE